METVSFFNMYRTNLFIALFQFSVPFLQNKESFFLLSFIRHQPLAIKIILYFGYMTPRRAEILQYPRCSTGQSRNTLQHIHVADIQIFLILLRKPFFPGTVPSIQSTSSKFADKDRFPGIEHPVHTVTFFRITVIPTHIFIETDNAIPEIPCALPHAPSLHCEDNGPDGQNCIQAPLPNSVKYGHGLLNRHARYSRESPHGY